MKESNDHWLRQKSEREGSRSEIVSALTQLGATVGSKENLRCAFHDDKSPSATLKLVDGKWFFSCHASSCNVTYDIWDLTGQIEGRTPKEVLKSYKKEVLDKFDADNAVKEKTEQRREEIRGVSHERDRATNKSSGFDTLDALIDHVLGFRRRKEPGIVLERRHPYTDPDTGVVSYCVLRLRDDDTGKKSYSQAYLDSRGKYVSSKPDTWKLSPLYNRTRLRSAQNILFVEGEVCVEEFTWLDMEGWAATTSPGGAGKSDLCDLTPLAGKNIYLWADNDPFDEKLKRCPGEHHMQEVATRVLSLDPPTLVKRVRHEELDLPEKGDIVDYLKEFKSEKEKVVAMKLVFQDAESLNTTRTLREQFAKIAAGTYEHLAIPDAERLSNLSKAFYPATVTLMCAEPGAAKSIWVTEKAEKFHALGRKVKVLMLEEDHAYWQRRVLAQIAGCADLTDIDWVKSHSKEALAMLNQHEERLDSFMRRVEIAPSRPDLVWAAAWVNQAAEEGNELIFVDPITAASSSDKAWIDDHEFLFAAKESMERTGARLFLTTHPRGGTKGKPTLDDLAGGRAYPRFSQTVFWLKRLPRPETNSVDPGDGNIADYVYEREIQIRKSRNGKGGGANIANILDHSTLCFVECGQIIDLD